MLKIKIVKFLLSSEKSRKAIGYTVGIVIFLLLLPMIVITGLFGWMGRSDVEIDRDEIISGLTPDEIKQIEDIDFETTGEETE